MDEREIRLACVGYAVDVFNAAGVGQGHVVQLAREIEAFVRGRPADEDELNGAMAMIEAGKAAVLAGPCVDGDDTAVEMALSIYRAMRAAAR